MGLDGVWYNELGSQVSLRTDGAGSLSGTYQSGVGAAGMYGLVGRYDSAATVQQSVVVGWIVNWANDATDSHSLTAWSGQYQLDAAGNEEIVSMWLLTMQAKTEDDWESTLVGKDVFTRNQPSEHHLKQAARRARPHPRGI